MSRGLWLVLGAMAIFAVVVLGVVAWAGLSGNAGSQRGLVIFNELDDTVTIHFAQGQQGDITPSDERTFVVKRDEFPSDVTAISSTGEVLTVRTFEYEDFADAEFRISLDERGFYPTATYRDPPPSPTPS